EDRTHTVGLELLCAGKSLGCDEGARSQDCGGNDSFAAVFVHEITGSGHGGPGESVLGKSLARMTGDDVGDLVPDHGGETGFALAHLKKAAVYADLASGEGKS